MDKFSSSFGEEEVDFIFVKPFHGAWSCSDWLFEMDPPNLSL
jgi:hypothetical protein